jgi:hypothetical protein
LQQRCASASRFSVTHCASASRIVRQRCAPASRFSVAFQRHASASRYSVTYQRPASSMARRHCASALRIDHRASRIAYRVSRIAHRASRIAYCMTRTAHRASHDSHRASCTAHRASRIAHRASTRRTPAQCIGTVHCRACAALLASCTPAGAATTTRASAEIERALRCSVSNDTSALKPATTTHYCVSDHHRWCVRRVWPQLQDYALRRQQLLELRPRPRQ